MTKEICKKFQNTNDTRAKCLCIKESKRKLERDVFQHWTKKRVLEAVSFADDE